MKTLKNLAVIAIIGFGLILLSSCGGIRIMPDNIDFLKGQEKIKVSYDYSDFSVGKYDKEADYVKMKMEKLQDDEPGKAEEWKNNWVGDRKSRYQPMFEELINKYTEDINLKIHPSYDDAKYTMIVKTTFIEPGYNVYVSRKPASINLIISFIETKNPGKVLGSIIVENSEGTSFGFSDYDTGERIKEAYAKAGKEVGKFLVKQLGN